MDLVVVGLNYRTAPLALRERLAVPPDRIPAALTSLAARPDLTEAVLLATCNRVEVWAASAGVRSAARQIRAHLVQAGADPAELSDALYEYAGAEAVRHIFRVTSSLDSMVVGEVQIAGQVKDAYAVAVEAGTAGPLLNRCMTSALHVAKRVRSETAVGRLGSSVAGVAAELAEKIFGELAGRRVLMVGSGEMAEAAVRHLRGLGATHIRICNRSPERAEALARDLDAQPRRWDDLEDCLVWADVCISSTSAPEPVIRTEGVSRVVRARRYRPLFLIDIAVPRDVEESVGRLSNVYLYDLDALQAALAENLAQRAREAQGAEALIREEVDAFVAWKGGLQAVPTIRALVERFTHVARAEEADLLSSLPSLGDKDRARVRATMDALVHKLLHSPLTALRRAGAEGDGVELVSATRRLFSLPDQAAPRSTAPDAPADDAETPLRADEPQGTRTR
jgi:glutamyl-tRNA reductase